jgi:hypothetical protein
MSRPGGPRPDTLTKHQAANPRLFDQKPYNVKPAPQPFEAGHKPNPNFEQPGEGHIGKYLYHHSDPKNRGSIAKHGLLPKDPLRRSAKGIETRETAPVGVYMGPHDHVASSRGGKSQLYTRDVYAIDTNKVRTRPDPSDNDNYWGFHHSEDSVPPNAMKLIHKANKNSGAY